VPLLDVELMSSLPEVLDSVRRNAVPALEAIGQTQAQVASFASPVDRLMQTMDEAFARLQDLPGVGLVSRLRGERPGCVGGRQHCPQGSKAQITAIIWLANRPAPSEKTSGTRGNA
jgi:hypothetical protein